MCIRDRDRAVKSNFHTLAYTYGKLFDTTPAAAGRLGERALDRLVLGKRAPEIRRRAFELLARWADGRWQPEWIKY